MFFPLQHDQDLVVTVLWFGVVVMALGASSLLC